MRTTIGILAAALMASAAFVEAGEIESMPFFDGKTLDGWTVYGGKATYTVEDGAIVGTTVDDSPNTFLCKGPFADFVLEFEVLCDVGLNSGVQVRSHVYEKDEKEGNRTHRKGTVYGYQCEIDGGEKKGVSGNFWDENRHDRWHDDFSNKPEARRAFQDGEWNRYRVVAQGDHIRSWINGVACADFRDKTDAGGLIGLQVHSIPKGTGPYKVRWRNLRLRELKPGDKLD